MEASTSRNPESSSSESNGVGNPQECPVCLEIFETPKVLPCGHSLCARCCRIMISKSNTINSFNCPKCQQLIKVPVGGLPTNYSLKDVMDALKVKKGKRKVSYPYNCTECLKSMALDVVRFCTECLKVLCSDCIIDNNHITHGFDSLQTVLKMNKEELEATLLKLDEMSESFCQTERTAVDEFLEHLQVTIAVVQSSMPIINKVCPSLNVESSSIRKELEKLRADMAHSVITGDFQHSFENIKNNISALESKREIVKKEISTLKVKLNIALDCLDEACTSLAKQIGGNRDVETTGQQVDAERTNGMSTDRGLTGLLAGGDVSQSDSGDEEGGGTSGHVFDANEGGNVRAYPAGYENWPRLCYNCDRFGHATVDCELPFRRVHLSVMAPCFNCSEQGHCSFQCPNPRQRQDFTCFFCYGRTHMTLKCPRMPGSSGYVGFGGGGVDNDGIRLSVFGRTNSDIDMRESASIGVGRGTPFPARSASGVGRTTGVSLPVNFAEPVFSSRQ